MDNFWVILTIYLFYKDCTQAYTLFHMKQFAIEQKNCSCHFHCNNNNKTIENINSLDFHFLEQY